jgi:hypothetical protein
MIPIHTATGALRLPDEAELSTVADIGERALYDEFIAAFNRRNEIDDLRRAARVRLGDLEKARNEAHKLVARLQPDGAKAQATQIREHIKNERRSDLIARGLGHRLAEFGL